MWFYGLECASHEICSFLCRIYVLVCVTWFKLYSISCPGRPDCLSRRFKCAVIKSPLYNSGISNPIGRKLESLSDSHSGILVNGPSKLTFIPSLVDQSPDVLDVLLKRDVTLNVEVWSTSDLLSEYRVKVSYILVFFTMNGESENPIQRIKSTTSSSHFALQDETDQLDLLTPEQHRFRTDQSTYHW